MDVLLGWQSVITTEAGPWITALLVCLLLVREWLVATDRYVGRTRYIDLTIAPLFLIFISMIGFILLDS